MTDGVKSEANLNSQGVVKDAAERGPMLEDREFDEQVDSHSPLWVLPSLVFLRPRAKFVSSPRPRLHCM